VRLDADQLEWIVREVVRRLEILRARPLCGEGRTFSVMAPMPSAHLNLSDNLITTATLEDRLQGVARLSVPARAVVTPSARDLLKERGVELVRHA
jgi:hypothetical protein